MATASILPLRHKATDEGVPLYLAIRHEGKRSTMSLSIRVKETHWHDEKKEVRRSHPEHAQLNRMLQDWRAEAQTELTRRQAEGESLDPAKVKAALQGEEDPAGRGFVAFCEDKIEEYRRREQISTARTYRTAVNHLKTYLQQEHGLEDIAISNLDGSIVSDMKTWFTEVKENKPNTIHKKLGSLHTMWNRARKEGHVDSSDQDPWEAVTLKKEQARKEKLTPSEIKALADLELDGLKAEMRDWFLFMFYAGGMRVSDICLLKRKHIQQDEDGQWRCRYRMKKTKEGAGVLLVDAAVEILKVYDFKDKEPDERVFPILDGYDLTTEEDVQRAIGSRTALMNRYLKEMAESADIDKTVTTHIARHSLAAYLYEEHGYDIYTIRDILGHANVRITQTYLDGFDYSTTDEAMKQVSLDDN